MKDKIFVAVVLLVCALLAFATPFVIDAAARGTLVQTGGEISDPVQLYFIGAIAMAVVYVLKLIAAKWPQVTIKREWLTVGLYVVSFVLALLWNGVAVPAFPAFHDPVTFVAALFGFVNALLVALALPVSFATLIYNILLKRVFDAWSAKAGWDIPIKG